MGGHLTQPGGLRGKKREGARRERRRRKENIIITLTIKIIAVGVEQDHGGSMWAAITHPDSTLNTCRKHKMTGKMSI